MKKPLKGGFFAAPISTTAKEYLVKNILEQQKSWAANLYIFAYKSSVSV